MFWIKIYDYFAEHRKTLWIIFAVVTVLLLRLTVTLRLSEDITDFLPLGSDESEALGVYRNISGMDRIICLFSNPNDVELTEQAIDTFASIVKMNDPEGWCDALVTRYDMNRAFDIMKLTYDNIPYLLQEKDYFRIDSLLSRPGYIAERMAQNRTALMFPSGELTQTVIVNDPLGLFEPVMNTLSSVSPHSAFELNDGYIFTRDMTKAIVMLTSPFGNSETSNNARLVALLRDAADEVETTYPGIEVHLTGGPVIAVGNSSCIKKDCLIAIGLSILLILLLLVFSFGSVRNILLIFLSISWGWLFAMGGMSLICSNVSLIVVGLSSVILGIAVNYPLHLVSHTEHGTDIRESVREISTPLTIGNITTVGAFLTLVPLQSSALRDLGVFSSLLLVGTIIFVLVCLPHILKDGGQKPARGRMIQSLARFKPENYRIIVLSVFVLTVVFGIFSTRTSFNSNLSDINYMTSEQRSDMDYFSKISNDGEFRDFNELYVISKGNSLDDALEQDARIQLDVDKMMSDGLIASCSGVRPLLCPSEEQGRRLEMWREFADRFKSQYDEAFAKAGYEAGFNDIAFSRFKSLLSKDFAAEPLDSRLFDILVSEVMASKLTVLNGKNYVVKVLRTKSEDTDEVLASIPECFDISEIDNSLSRSISDNFNYIGLTCSLIVFLFLFFSFGSLNLALISFLPMAVSWLWILGLMSILGIQFNIVNIILATFIFGQGDDYTIFITEGCQYEYARGKSIMTSYKSSIAQSALIMFIGIGTLVVARHPAMKSLAQVTIIGMFSVVFMAYLIPPLLFKWLTTKNGEVRKYPLTLRSILFGIPEKPVDLVMGRYIYKGNGICREVRRNLSKTSCRTTEDSSGEIVVKDTGYGEIAILTAYLNKDKIVRACMEDEERMEIAKLSAKGFVTNIEFVKNDK